MEDAEILLASSPTDAGISCWNVRSGEELLLHKLCSSPPHGLATVAGRFLASSQLRDSTSGSTFHWSWNKKLEILGDEIKRQSALTSVTVQFSDGPIKELLDSDTCCIRNFVVAAAAPVVRVMIQ